MTKQSIENITLNVETRILTLALIRSSKRKRSLSLSVNSATSITLRVPLRTPLSDIDTFLLRQTKWLLKKIHEYEKHEQLRQEYGIPAITYPSKEILAIFLARAHFWGELLKVRFGKLSLSHAKNRWGSCSANNDIRINRHLIRAPLHLLDYVIVHELCHVIHKNHSSAFWNFVASVMPDYKSRRKELNCWGSLLL